MKDYQNTVNTRMAGLAKWKEQHPEGITPANFRQFREFMAKFERENKEQA
jgi:hypothetical protein